MALVLGLNSGSSFDGVDAVIVDIEHGPDGYPTRPTFVAGNSYAWPTRSPRRCFALSTTS
jgi:anhydro-N-acetylmuramic acid kinase